jgi:hypothetical protein
LLNDYLTSHSCPAEFTLTESSWPQIFIKLVLLWHNYFVLYNIFLKGSVNCCSNYIFTFISVLNIVFV